MKVCPKCKKNKSLNEFGNNSKNRDNKQRTCKVCVKQEQIKCYNKDKTKYIQRNISRQKQIKEEFIEYKKQLKCCKCNENRYWVLDFHHINKNEKENFIHKILYSFGGINSDNFKNEIQKCKIFCSNCHRDFHYLEKEKNINIEEYLK
jgi:hypothetical protein